MEGVVYSLRCGKRKEKKKTKNKNLPFLQNNRLVSKIKTEQWHIWHLRFIYLPPVQWGKSDCIALLSGGQSSLTFNLWGWASECRSMYAVQLCYQKKDYLLVWERVEQITPMCWLSLICLALTSERPAHICWLTLVDARARLRARAPGAGVVEEVINHQTRA